MKRALLIRHLKSQGCKKHREGKKHTVFINTRNQKVSTVPRHKTINDFLAVKICKDLDVPKIEKH